MSVIVPGHALVNGGAAYAETSVRNRYDSQGHGKCSCGERSPWLDSNAKRKAWHRQHKLDVLAGDGRARVGVEVTPK
jgi:hypothetical protein